MSRAAPADDPHRPVTKNEPWHGVDRLAIPAGWIVALAAFLPSILWAASPGERAAAILALPAVLAWWIAVVVTIRSDLRHFIIPDEASFATAVLGLALAIGAPLLRGDGLEGAANAAVAALATGTGAFLVFWLTGASFRRFGRDALGFDDVKLAGAASLWLAPGDAANALEVAALGAILVLLLRRTGGLRETAVPFGAFLALCRLAGLCPGPDATWTTQPRPRSVRSDTWRTRSPPCDGGSPSPSSRRSTDVHAASRHAAQPHSSHAYDAVRLDPLLSDRSAPLSRKPSRCGWRRTGSRGCSAHTEKPILRGVGSSVCRAPFNGTITGGEISVAAGSVDKLALLREVRGPQGGAAGAV